MSYKILLADDSVTVQKIITLTFSDEGVDVLTVNNGDEALHRLQYLRPALVMADVSIPGHNGYEICEFVKSHPDMKNTPVILLVPAFEPFDEERARRIGADYHLVKPFQSIRTLIATVKSLIEPGSAPKPTSLSPSSEAVEPPPAEQKKTKIEELLQIAGSNGTSELEDEHDLLEPLGEAPAVAAPAEESVLPLAAASEPLSELAPPPVSVLDEFDDLLELDDVLPELHAAPIAPAPAPEPAPVASAQAPAAPAAWDIPQHVIDEIVRRVVAEVTEKLTASLAGEIAHRLKPEIAESVRGHYAAEPVPLRVTESLLDID